MSARLRRQVGRLSPASVASESGQGAQGDEVGERVEEDQGDEVAERSAGEN